MSQPTSRSDVRLVVEGRAAASAAAPVLSIALPDRSSSRSAALSACVSGRVCGQCEHAHLLSYLLHCCSGDAHVCSHAYHAVAEACAPRGPDIAAQKFETCHRATLGQGGAEIATAIIAHKAARQVQSAERGACLKASA